VSRHDRRSVTGVGQIGLDVVRQAATLIHRRLAVDGGHLVARLEQAMEGGGAHLATRSRYKDAHDSTH
jgi:Zn-dependent alcohol dehydrogenase